jgi:DNA helicase-2/ATP-dependent DNA helicase PcrA
VARERGALGEQRVGGHDAIHESPESGLLRADLPDLRLVVDQRFAFAPGIDIVEANQVKGLEFDYVIIVEVSARHYPDTGHHRRLLHVAATRAVHQLWLTCVGTPSPILPEAVR